LIKEAFEEDEVAAICQIWRCTKNGEFIMRNAYHLEMAIVVSGKGKCSIFVGMVVSEKGYGR
jgi:hypothetical protein